MAEGDRQLAFTTGPLPVSVQVSGADKLTPKAVNASFDGTGAAGAFLPCLIITGRTGHEVARIPAQQVAAGASAKVSWFPRVGGSSGGGPSGGGPVEVFHDGFGPSAANLAWTALPWVHQSGPSLLNLVAPTAPTFVTAGIYAVTVCARDQSGTTWPGSINLWLAFAAELEDHASITTASADTGMGGFSRVPQVTVTEIRTVFAGERVQALTSQNSGVAKNIGLVHAVVQQLA